ncbi:MAG: hypothetical protein WCT14_21640, partial [Treponemataceae bacterium]
MSHPGIAWSLRVMAVCSVLLLLTAVVSAQTAVPDSAPTKSNVKPATKSESGKAADPAAMKAVPSAFRAFTLGMELEALKTALAADELFTFRGDRDVSLLPKSEQVLIETTGLSFIRRAFFQLKDGKVFMMAFSLDPEKVDHYSVFTSLVAEYGDPAALDPKEAVWTSSAVRLSIERPLTVKYIDKVVFDELARNASVKKSKEFVLREEFLNGF